MTWPAGHRGGTGREEGAALALSGTVPWRWLRGKITRMKEDATSGGPIHEVKGPQKAVLAALGWAVRRWQASLEYTGLEAAREHWRQSAGGSLILLWHNRLFPCIGALREVGMGDGQLYGLVSASRDGGQLAAFLRSLGIRPVRGSSSRHGSTAARQLLRLLRQGRHVAITMDGPRGPCYHAHAGAAMLCLAAHVPAFLVSAELESAHELPSWDRFLIPNPGSRVRLHGERLVEPGLVGKQRLAREALRLDLESRLRKLTHDSHRRSGL